jgi:hypothetical protein
MPFFSHRVNELVNPEKCSLQNKRCPQLDGVTGVPRAGLESAQRITSEGLEASCVPFGLNRPLPV